MESKQRQNTNHDKCKWPNLIIQLVTNRVCQHPEHAEGGLCEVRDITSDAEAEEEEDNNEDDDYWMIVLLTYKSNWYPYSCQVKGPSIKI